MRDRLRGRRVHQRRHPWTCSGSPGDVLTNPTGPCGPPSPTSRRDGPLETFIRLFLLDEPVERRSRGGARIGSFASVFEALGPDRRPSDGTGARARPAGPAWRVPHRIGPARPRADPSRPRRRPPPPVHRPLPTSPFGDQVGTALDVGHRRAASRRCLRLATPNAWSPPTSTSGRLSSPQVNADLNKVENDRIPAGQLLRARRRRDLRAGRLQPAVRHLARIGVRLSRQRARPRPCQRASRRRAAGVPRGGRLRDDHGQLDPGGRRSRGASARRGSTGRAATPGSSTPRSRTCSRPPPAGTAAWRRTRPVSATPIDRWLAYFEREGIPSLAYGALILRKRSGGPNWIRSRELPGGSRHDPADHLLRLFTGPDASAELSDEALAETRLRLADGAVIRTEHRLDPDGWAETFEMGLRRGIPFTGSAGPDDECVPCPARWRAISLGEVLDAFAASNDAPAADARASGVPIARELLELGLAVRTGHHRRRRFRLTHRGWRQDD